MVGPVRPLISHISFYSFVSLRDAEELNRVEDHAGNAFKYGGPGQRNIVEELTGQVARWEDLIGPSNRTRINNSAFSIASAPFYELRYSRACLDLQIRLSVRRQMYF